MNRRLMAPASMAPKSGLDGKFSFAADPGTHLLQVSFVGYEPIERTVTVTAGTITRADLELKALAIEIGMVEVAAVRRTETEGAVVMISTLNSRSIRSRMISR